MNSIKVRHFRIYGDNIIECERTIELLLTSLSLTIDKLKGPFGFPSNPRFKIEHESNEETFEFTYFPGFGRWDFDILESIRSSGGVIREAPDAIITEILEQEERLILAIEFSTALSAGNQAWQRNGRAYSLGLSRIPYLYINEVGGHELSGKRERKTTRLPNPAVPFSYLTFSNSIRSIVLPVYYPQDGMDKTDKKKYQDIFGKVDLYQLINELLFSINSEATVLTMEKRVLEFVKILADRGKNKRSFTSSQWVAAYNYIKKGTKNTLCSYLKNVPPINWSKTAYIDSLTSTFKDLKSFASGLCWGFTSGNLPICLLPKENRKRFATKVLELYPNLDKTFSTWLDKEEDLVLCWVMGFKPKGDDARPDRGLPPLTRMLVGPDTEILTIVYGPAKSNQWAILVDNPKLLANQNGLWEAIMAVSDGILVDSSTFNQENHGIVKAFWSEKTSKSMRERHIASEVPTTLGEQDVDTLIHLIFAKLGGSKVFESFCNPPGGDWSGISLLSSDRKKQVRWFSLPRVGDSKAKRPDHVIELFDITRKPLVFSIESKERARDLERNIGYRLNLYMKNLMSFNPDVEIIENEDSEWKNSTMSLIQDDYILVSGASFLVGSKNELDRYIESSEVDLLIAFMYWESKKGCSIYLRARTDIGKVLEGYVRSLNLSGLTVKVEPD